MKKLLLLLLLFGLFALTVGCTKPKLKTEYRLEITSTQQYNYASVSIQTDNVYKGYGQSFFDATLNPTFVFEFVESKNTGVRAQVIYSGDPIGQLPEQHYMLYKNNKLVKDYTGNDFKY